MSSHVEFVDTRKASDETLAALHELHLLQDEEVLPGDPPVPLQQRMLDWRYQLDTEGIYRWVIWKGTRSSPHQVSRWT